MGHSYKFQWVSRLGSVTARQSSSERQPNFAALNRGRHLYSAGHHVGHWPTFLVMFIEQLTERERTFYVMCREYLSVFNIAHQSSRLTATSAAVKTNLALVLPFSGSLWSPYGIGQTIILSCCDFHLSIFFFFPRLISAAAHWMFTILLHMVWP